MNKLIKIVRKIIASFLLIYSVNLIIYKVDVIIPINLATISTVTLLGIPGFLTLFVLYKIV